MFKCTRIRELEKLKLVLGATTSKYLQECVFEVKIQKTPSHNSLLFFGAESGVAAKLWSNEID